MKKKQKGVSGLDEVRSFLDLFSNYSFSEVEWTKTDGTKIRVSNVSGMTTQVLTHQAAPQAVAAKAETPVAPKESETEHYVLKSPFVGTFYRSASPKSEPYVGEGQQIKVGDVLCIVEAMKLMNEIETEVAGKIVKICVENGQAVEFGTPLFWIEQR